MTAALRREIASEADAAAAAWTRDPQASKPANPYHPVTQQLQHRSWAADFERALLLHSCPDCERGC